MDPYLTAQNATQCLPLIQQNCDVSRCTKKGCCLHLRTIMVACCGVPIFMVNVHTVHSEKHKGKERGFSRMGK